MTTKRNIEGLYLITDHRPEGELLERVRSAVGGGVRTVQYRDKERPAGEKDRLGRRLAEICRNGGALFLVNDDPELALRTGADGVHLGQQDLKKYSLGTARKILGPDRIIGVSTRTPEQARKAEGDGADYVALGSVYPTATKDDAVHVGLGTLHQVCATVQVPVVAIGGIDRDRAGAVIDAGARSIAVISAVMNDPDPALAAREISLLFNRRRHDLPKGHVLIVAGSDSGGGAGIQADLRTVGLLGCHGSTVVTALTAQNTRGVRGIHPVPPDFVGEQIEAVAEDLPPDVVKTGMLFSSGIVNRVAEAIERNQWLAVVDPVMIAKGGSRLLEPAAVVTLQSRLLPLAFLLTPNLPEAEALTGILIRNEGEMAEAARRLQDMGARNVLLKGGHLEEEPVDLLLSGSDLMRFPGHRIATSSTHGTGCTFASAVAALLSRGEPLPQAVGKAKEFISEALRQARPMGDGHGPVNHWAGARAANREP